MIDATLPLFPIEEKIEALVNTAEMVADEDREEFVEELNEYLKMEAAKVDSIGWVLSQLAAVQAHARSETERLRQRQQAAEKAERNLEGYILRVLARRNGKPLKGKNITLFARRTEVLIVDDPDAVPAEWKRTTVTVDVPKEPIKRAIKEGVEIPGVHIEPREHLVKR